MSLTKATFSMIQGAVYNVLDYIPTQYHAGIADGSNTTPLTTYIQSAIDAASATVYGSASGGGVIFFPTGVYLSGALSITTQFVSIQGEGWSASEIRSSGAVNPLLTIGDSTSPSAAVNFNMFVRDIKLSTGGAANSIVYLKNCSHWRFENVWMEGSIAHTTTTLILASALIGVFEQCWIRGATQYAVDIYKLSGYATIPNYITFRNCTVTTAGVFGLRYRDGAFLMLEDCDFEGNGNTNDVDHGGVYIASDTSPNGEGISAAITNCWFEGNQGTHIRMDEHSFGPGGTIITNCIGVSGTITYGVYASAVTTGHSNVRMYDCSFQNAATRDYYFASGVSATLYNCIADSVTLSSTTNAFPNPSTGTQSTSTAAFQSFGYSTFTDGSTTPSVTKAGLYVAANTSATSITNFTNGVDGQILMINADNGNTTLVNGSTLRLAGGVNKTMATRDMIQLVHRSGVWYQMSYSTN